MFPSSLHGYFGVVVVFREEDKLIYRHPYITTNQKRFRVQDEGGEEAMLVVASRIEAIVVHFRVWEWRRRRHVVHRSGEHEGFDDVLLITRLGSKYLVAFLDCICAVNNFRT
ncbi:unnamed protein product [Sphagnum balticum]